MERLSLFQFAYWLRTGRVPVEEPDQLTELKFNPNHDPANGQFTFAGEGGSGGGGAVLRTMGLPVMGSPASPAPAAGRRKKADKRPKPASTERQNDRTAISDDATNRFKSYIVPYESDKNYVYLDSNGIPTVGIGHKVAPGDNLKLGDQISETRKNELWRKDSASALSAAQRQMQVARISDENFLLPLASVNFQLGGEWYKEHKKTWSLILKGDYRAAAYEAQNSVWYRQSPKRVAAFQRALLALPSKTH
jgi:GH24 family phage-related lysozyme (muramidase)